MASSRMPRLIAWVARVWRSWWGWTWPIPARLATRPTMRWTVRPVERGAVVGDEAALGADVVGVEGGPVGEEGDEVGVQRDVAVVAQLADRDAQPVVVADLGDGVGGEVAELTGA